jgi:hypothetical protein
MNLLILGALVWLFLSRSATEPDLTVGQWLQYYGDNPSLLPANAKEGDELNTLILQIASGTHTTKSEAIERMHGTWEEIQEIVAVGPTKGMDAWS